MSRTTLEDEHLPRFGILRPEPYGRQAAPRAACDWPNPTTCHHTTGSVMWRGRAAVRDYQGKPTGSARIRGQLSRWPTSTSPRSTACDAPEVVGVVLPPPPTRLRCPPRRSPRHRNPPAPSSCSSLSSFSLLLLPPPSFGSTHVHSIATSTPSSEGDIAPCHQAPCRSVFFSFFSFFLIFFLLSSFSHHCSYSCYQIVILFFRDCTGWTPRGQCVT